MSESLVFLEPAQIHAVAEVAFKALEGYAAFMDDLGGRRSDREVQRHTEEFAAALEALRFCALAAGMTGDSSFAPLLHDIGVELTNWTDYARDHDETLAEGVSILVRRGARADEDLALLADHELEAVRRALADGLAPEGPALALLEKLAGDSSSAVRAAALAKLATVREVVWWSGVFASDPMARLDPEEATRCEEALRAAASAVLDRKSALAPALRKLPDPLASEAAEAALADPNARGDADAAAVAAILLARPGGAEALERLAVRWQKGGFAVEYAGEQAALAGARAVPKRARVALSLALARAAFTAPNDSERRYHSPADVLAKAAAAAFPEGADVTPLLDLALEKGSGEDAREHVVRTILEPLAAKKANLRRVLPRLFEARLAGWPGAHRHMIAPDALLLRAPRRALRRAAEQALGAEDDGTAAWALEVLLGPARDPARDGPRSKLVRRFFAEPRYRALIGRTSGLARLAVPLLRAELRAGRLGFPAAYTTLHWVTRFWGGSADIVVFGPSHEPPTEDPGKEHRAGLRGLLGPPALQGPPTDEEWARYRTARAAEPPRDWRRWREQMGLMPPGPWHPADRALLDACVAEARASDGGHAWLAAMALAGKPFVEDAPLMDELAGLDSDRRYVRDCRERFREALGLSIEAAAPGAPPADAAPPAVAWIDRDD
jgi:hypothetical protein